MNRKQRRALQRHGIASGPAMPPPWSAMPPRFSELLGAAVSLHKSGAIAEAEDRYRQILTLFPDRAETHSMLGVSLFEQGRIGEALPFFERAAALVPKFAGAYDDLARAYMAAGKPQLAVPASANALELEETERRRTLFADYARCVEPTVDHPQFRKFVTRALTEAWARPRDLSFVCASVIKTRPEVKACAQRASAAWPNRLCGDALCGASALARIARDDLLLRLLEAAPVPDLGLERLLTCIRLAMLNATIHLGDKAHIEDDLLSFYCAVAWQCFLNEYVFSVEDGEFARAEALRERIAAALTAGAPCPPLWIAACGAYFPLHSLSDHNALLRRQWPGCIEALLTQQVREPIAERELAATIPVLTAIDDDVSRVVRQQYEENPYPRWIKGGPPGTPAVLTKEQIQRGFDVLIAGCGTGLFTIEFARAARHARILAVDLSRASLGYAKRMAKGLGVSNVEFAQADIMKLGALDRRFDFIHCVGVLHHLADPWAGWRVLLSLLRPGGVMEMGLYSAAARGNVLVGRDLIARRGYRPILPDIRRCREEIVAAKDNALLQSLLRSADFFSASECRDLLFHPQENRMTLLEIKSFLKETGFQFLGFTLPQATLHRFAARFPAASAMADLDRWHEFEAMAPDTFAGMYFFCVQKLQAQLPPIGDPRREN